MAFRLQRVRRGADRERHGARSGELRPGPARSRGARGHDRPVHERGGRGKPRRQPHVHLRRDHGRVAEDGARRRLLHLRRGEQGLGRQNRRRGVHEGARGRRRGAENRRHCAAAAGREGHGAFHGHLLHARADAPSDRAGLRGRHRAGAAELPDHRRVQRQGVHRGRGIGLGFLYGEPVQHRRGGAAERLQVRRVEAEHGHECAGRGDVG